ncbi:hypothetical protein GF339_17760 [candidate division KSB3 bacterium]|uniref:Periplasmic heavy metal sensor n=1 Tax=candidate division KSB3 bacterium TaxID=2044937 RepID=A0A9D5JYM7_9BACT|nr:hypothetical protein [candidate division KSB3 bacterium]MBD3326435.1 hypothetical protein [candidate division KSB3 bacterium]
MKLRYYIVGVFVGLLLICSGRSGSQVNDGGGAAHKENVEHGKGEAKEQEIYRLLDRVREARLVEELELSEDKARAVIENMRYARKLKGGYWVKRSRFEKTLHVLLEAPVPDQANLDAVLQQLDQMTLHYHQQLLAVEGELQKILTPEERAKYILFQRNFNEELQELISNIRQRNNQGVPRQNQLLRKDSTESVIRQSR